MKRRATHHSRPPYFVSVAQLAARGGVRFARAELRPRGTAVIAIVVALVMLQVFVAAALVGGAREQDLTVKRLDTTRAYWAGEAGAHMAVRELAGGADHDGDGGIGSISADGLTGNDPLLSGGRVSVSIAAAGGVTTITVVGRAGDAVRSIELTTE